MKRIFAAMLTFVMLLALTACGAVEETVPTETEPEETQPTLEYAFVVPSRTESYKLSIKLGDEWYIENYVVQPGAASVIITLTGTGTQVYDLYIDGEFYAQETVELTPDG